MDCDFSRWKSTLTERSYFEWAKEVEERGAGDNSVTSMEIIDGTKDGFANEA